MEEYGGSCHYSQLYIKRQGAWTSFDKRWGIVAGFSAREHPGRAYVISWITVEWCVNESGGGSYQSELNTHMGKNEIGLPPRVLKKFWVDYR